MGCAEHSVRRGLYKISAQRRSHAGGCHPYEPSLLAPLADPESDSSAPDSTALEASARLGPGLHLWPALLGPAMRACLRGSEARRYPSPEPLRLLCPQCRPQPSWPCASVHAARISTALRTDTQRQTDTLHGGLCVNSPLLSMVPDKALRVPRQPSLTPQFFCSIVSQDSIPFGNRTAVCTDSMFISKIPQRFPLPPQPTRRTASISAFLSLKDGTFFFLTSVTPNHKQACYLSFCPPHAHKHVLARTPAHIHAHPHTPSQE